MTEETKKHLARAASYCSKAEHCVSEVEEKLRLWGAPEDDIRTILTYLRTENYIDHRRYAAFYARDKFRFNGWGRRKIELMLREKRIESEAISDGIGEIEESLYEDKLSELLRQKRKTISDADPYAIKTKLYRFAQSRGFESNVIGRVLQMEIDD